MSAPVAQMNRFELGGVENTFSIELPSAKDLPHGTYDLFVKDQWLPMESAPTDGTIVNVMGRYKDAERGFPRYAGFYDGEWCEFSRHLPEPLVCWAWRPRDSFESWPSEDAA